MCYEPVLREGHPNRHSVQKPRKRGCGWVRLRHVHARGEAARPLQAVRQDAAARRPGTVPDGGGCE
jgi:hypothetical protein